jgi:HEAT repeat protein
MIASTASRSDASTLTPTLDELTTALAAKDPHARAHARAELVQRGADAVAPLVELLASPHAALRWEAAKTLAAIGDPAAMEGLIGALDDPDGPVRWLAAEGLIAIGPACVAPLLRLLLTHGGDAWLIAGAHHVLRAFRDEATQPVLTALGGSMPSLEGPLAAYHALDRIEGPVRA